MIQRGDGAYFANPPPSPSWRSLKKIYIYSYGEKWRAESKVTGCIFIPFCPRYHILYIYILESFEGSKNEGELCMYYITYCT